jgi:caffeoyl-CoA O-methyltransferase
VSFEIDDERRQAAAGYLDRAGLSSLVDLRLQDAREGLGGLDGAWDLAFIDAAKGQYDAYFDLIVPRLRPGGLILADNALMSGTVATGEPDGVWSAEAIQSARTFLGRFLAHPQLAATVLPVGDGVALGVRRD